MTTTGRTRTQSGISVSSGHRKGNAPGLRAGHECHLPGCRAEDITTASRGGCRRVLKPRMPMGRFLGEIATAANRTREIRPSGMRWGLSGNVGYGEPGRSAAHIERVRVGNPSPKVARAALLPDGLVCCCFLGISGSDRHFLLQQTCRGAGAIVIRTPGSSPAGVASLRPPYTCLSPDPWKSKAATSRRTAPKMRGGKHTTSPSPKPGLPLVSATLR